MRFLILGAQGMLGGEFVRQLQNISTRQHDSMVAVEVVGWGREDLDITNEQEVMQKVVALKPQIILNCAAYNNVDKAEDEPELANAINGEAVGYLARAAAQCGATLVHFSTDYVFGGTREDGYNEEDAPDPVSKYGESKALGEKRVLEISGGLASGSNRRQGLPVAHWYIIRTSKLFGPSGTGATAKKSFPEIMIKIAREKGRVEAVDAEAGSPTYVKDLVEATRNLIGISPSPDFASAQSPSPLGRGEGEGQCYPSGIYHITNSGSCTWYEYAKAALEYACLRRQVGLRKVPVIPVGPDYFPRKAKRPERVVLLNTKLPPLRFWQEALKEFLTRAVN